MIWIALSSSKVERYSKQFSKNPDCPQRTHRHWTRWKIDRTESVNVFIRLASPKQSWAIARLAFSAGNKSANTSSETSGELMTLCTFPHQYRRLNASKMSLRILREVIGTILIRGGVEKNFGHLKYLCCSKTLGRCTKTAAIIWCHKCRCVVFKCGGIDSPGDYEKSTNFPFLWCLKNTKIAPNINDLALHGP